MSIAEKTLRQLVNNRLHTLCDMALEISAGGELYPGVTIYTSSAIAVVTVRAKGSEKMLVSTAAEYRADNALEQLDELIRWLGEQTAQSCQQAPAE